MPLTRVQSAYGAQTNNSVAPGVFRTDESCTLDASVERLCVDPTLDETRPVVVLPQSAPEGFIVHIITEPDGFGVSLSGGSAHTIDDVDPDTGYFEMEPGTFLSFALSCDGVWLSSMVEDYHWTEVDTDIYVNALTGSDSNSGLTPNRPLKTNRKAGDIIGIYKEFLHVSITVHWQTDIPSDDTLDAAILVKGENGSVNVTSDKWTNTASGTLGTITTINPNAPDGGQPWAVNLGSHGNYRGKRIRLTATVLDCKTLATSNVALSGLPTIGGVSLSNNDRVFLTGQTTAKDNGVWVAHGGAWTRPAAYPNGGNFNGTFFYVTAGAFAGVACYIESFGGPDVIGTDAPVCVFELTAPKKGQINSGAYSWVDRNTGGNTYETLEWGGISYEETFALYFYVKPKQGDTFVIEEAVSGAIGNLQAVSGTSGDSLRVNNTRLVPFSNSTVWRLGNLSGLVCVGTKFDGQSANVLAGTNGFLLNCCRFQAGIVVNGGSDWTEYLGGIIQGDLECARGGTFTGEAFTLSESFCVCDVGGQLVMGVGENNGTHGFSSRNTPTFQPINGINLFGAAGAINSKLWGGNNSGYGIAEFLRNATVDFAASEVPNITGVLGDFFLSQVDGGGNAVAQVWDQAANAGNGEFVAPRACTWVNFANTIGAGGFDGKPVNVARNLSIYGDLP